MSLHEVVQNDDAEMTPEQEKSRQERIDRLSAFSDTIKKLRQIAIDARKQMGIEDQWQEDEDFYEAIDDANRTTASRIKPYDFGGTGTGPTQLPASGGSRSSIFVPMTRPYVDMASALIADLYLPTDDRNWDGEPTPVPDLIKQANDLTPLVHVAQQMQSGQPVPPTLMGKIRNIFGGQPPQPPMADPSQVQAQPQPNQPPMQGGAPVPQTVGDLAQQEIDKADESWKKARARIDDWLLECKYNAEMRKVIKDKARIGVGIMKGPFPKLKSGKAVIKTPEGYAVEIQQKTIPASKRIDPWRFFPDPSCGEDINLGSYVFEEDCITRNKLRDLSKIEGLNYIKSQIDACLEEGPTNSIIGTKNDKKNSKSESDLFYIWYFEGQVEWQDLNDAGCFVDGEKGDSFRAVVTMVNDRVIKASLSHLDSDEFTYDVTVWQRKSGLWIGDGVARQGRTAQRGLNAAVRNLMDNAGQSSRPHKVINRKVIAAGQDPWTWYMKGDADSQQVAHAMMFFSVPSMQQELMEIIKYFSKMFEDATGLPMMMQGQQGAAPETVGGMQLLMNNASIVPRDIVRRLDDCITEPQINRYYEYLLIHGEDDSEKGEFDIHARGSSALMERAAQDQFLLKIAEYATNPAFGLDPELFIEELLKSVRINPQRLKLSDEKKKAMQSRPPPEDPRVTAAKIMAAAGVQRVQAQGQIEGQLQAAKTQADLQQSQQEIAHEQQLLQTGGATPHVAQAMSRIEQEKIRAATSQAIENSRANAEMARAQKEQEIAYQNGQQKTEQMHLQKDIALLEYANREKINLDTVKAQLAKSAMDNQTKKQLAAAEIQLAQTEGDQNRSVDMHKHNTSLVRDMMSTPDTP